MRDFTIGDMTVPAAHRGTLPRLHRHRLRRHAAPAPAAGAGPNPVHLLPVFDIATFPERRADDRPPRPAMPSSTARLRTSSRRPSQRRPNDCFNWGYDPGHYTTPEGSYATDPPRCRPVHGSSAAMVAVLTAPACA